MVAAKFMLTSTSTTVNVARGGQCTASAGNETARTGGLPPVNEPVWICMLACALVGCGAAPVTPEAPTASAAPRVLIVDRIGAERFVILGPAELTREEGRVVSAEQADVEMVVVPQPGDVPQLTLLGRGGNCTATRAERVRVERRYGAPEREGHEEYSAAFDAIRVEASCAPELAIDRADARLVAIDFPEGDEDDLDAPIVGTSPDGWRVEIDYPPSPDGICPGSPATIRVASPGGASFAPFETTFWIARTLLFTSRDGPHLVIFDPTQAALHDLRRSEPRDLGGFPNGYDLAETCL